MKVPFSGLEGFEPPVHESKFHCLSYLATIQTTPPLCLFGTYDTSTPPPPSSSFIFLLNHFPSSPDTNPLYYHELIPPFFNNLFYSKIKVNIILVSSPLLFTFEGIGIWTQNLRIKSPLLFHWAIPSHPLPYTGSGSRCFPFLNYTPVYGQYPLPGPSPHAQPDLNWCSQCEKLMS